MNKKIETVFAWYKKRKPREKLFLILLSFAVIYFLWDFFLISPIVKQQTTLKSTIQLMQLKTKTATQQIMELTNIVNSPEFVLIYAEKKRLIQQTQTLKQKIVTLKPYFISVADLPKLTKDILTAQNDTFLVSLKSLNSTPWTPIDVTKTKVLTTIVQLPIQIEFKSNYFNTIAYLINLEKLPWHIYWESLNYKVTQYPEANVEITFYTLNSNSNLQTR